MTLLDLQALEAQDAVARHGGRNPVQSNISLLICQPDDSGLSLVIC